jgi:Protein of unknown function (DUF1592)/Protein of unknown function (DUF1595)/Protein of unknown function (DUF1588)
MRRSTFWTCATVSLFAAGCAGQVGDAGVSDGGTVPPPGGSGSGGSGSGGAGSSGSVVTLPPPDSLVGCTAASYQAPLQMLNQFELRNTIKDLVGPVTTEVLVPQGARGQYRGALLIDELPRRWQDTAWGIAGEASKNAAALTGCAAANQTDACASAFIGKFAAKAYRRPLAAGELESLVALYANGKAEGFASGIEMVVAAVLQDPSFLYRVEAGVPNSVKDHPELRRLTGAEVAQRLSYSLWGTLPDDALTMAAQSGGLDTPAGIRAQAERMLKDPRAIPMFADFVGQWLLTDHLGENPKDAIKYPAFAAAVPLLREELNLFVRDLVQNGGDLRTLFTADYGFLNAKLAVFYGVPGVSGDVLVKTTMPASAQRSGLLTFSGLLSIEGIEQGVSLAKSNRTFPIGRARFIRERLACEDLPPPIADATNLPSVKGLIDAQNARYGGAQNVPPRAFFQEITSQDTTCKACHGFLEPLGFILERFGPDGLIRQNDIDGMPAIQSGRYNSNGKNAELVGDYASPAALATAMSKSSSVKDCFTGNLVQYAMGQATDVRQGCFSAAAPTADASGTRLLDVYLDLAASDPFRIRTVD